jgi:hypothetical protein
VAGKPRGKRYLENLGIGGRITLKQIVETGWEGSG